MSDSQKAQVGEAISKLLEDNTVIGVGTGSTVDAAIEAIGKRVTAEKLNLKAVCTSHDSARACEQAGITVLASSYTGAINLGFDGVDAIDERLRAVKGKGAALLLEKILAVRCLRYVYLADASKKYDDIARCLVPVEVVPEAIDYVQSQIQQRFSPRSISLREAKAKHGAVITEKGNFIVDVQFKAIEDSLESELKTIVGVVESGLFLNYAQEALIATDAGVTVLKR